MSKNNYFRAKLKNIDNSAYYRKLIKESVLMYVDYFDRFINRYKSHSNWKRQRKTQYKK
jgi:hypothetical protein